MSEPEPLLRARVAAAEFLRAALQALEQDGVIPPPRFHPYLEVGRDYYGPELMPLIEFRSLEAALEAAYPKRFAESIPLRERDFPNSYIFPLLETCIARLTLENGFDSPAAIIEACAAELIETLSASETQVAVCRVISHVTAAGSNPVQLGDVTLVPEGDDLGDLNRQLNEAIPGAWSAFNREPPVAFDPPEALLIAKGSATNPFDEADRLSSLLDRFLLHIRLLFANTAESFYEVRGETRPIRRLKPDLRFFRRSRLMGSVRRTLRLDTSHERPIVEFAQLIESLGIDRTDMAVTSFDMALLKYSESFLGTPWYDQLVDLSTALEAVLSGQDKEDVVLRLRSRGAALLCAPNDSATAIFRDLGELYGLRSTLVHGGSLPINKALRTVRKLSTAQPDTFPGFEIALGIERLRDLVRRAILARIALGTGPEPRWPLQAKVAVDAVLADDEIRAQWRTSWRAVYEEIGAANSVNRSRPAAASISRDDSAADTSEDDGP